jgi:hypothetical protein
MVELNCWVLHPVARVSTNAFLKTAVRNNVFVFDFIVHYLLHVSAPYGGHLQVTDPLTYTVVTLIYILCTYYLKMATDRAETCSK